MQTAGDAAMGLLDSVNRFAGSVANTVDTARRIEGEAIYSQAKLDIQKRQNQILDGIKGDSSIPIDKWEEEYLARSETLSEGYDTVDNKYAAPEIRNLLAGAKEDARAKFAQAETGYRLANAYVGASNLISSGIEDGDLEAVNRGVYLAASIDNDPMKTEEVKRTAANSFFLTGATKLIDENIANGPDEIKRQIAANGDNIIIGGSSYAMTDAIKDKLLTYADNQWEAHKTSNDKAVVSREVPEFYAAENNVAAVAAWKEKITNPETTTIYDGWTRDRLASLADAKMASLAAGNKDILQDKAEAAFYISQALTEDTNPTDAVATVQNLYASGKLDAPGVKRTLGAIEMNDIQADAGFKAIGLLTKTANPKDKPALTEAQGNAIGAIFLDWRAKNRTASQDDIDKFINTLTNKELVAGMAKSMRSGKIRYDENSTDANEAMTASLEGGYFGFLQDNGLWDTFTQAMGIPENTKYTDIVNEYRTTAEKTMKGDYADMMKRMKVNAKVHKITSQVDKALGTVVVTVSLEDPTGKPFTENYEMRILTINDMAETTKTGKEITQLSGQGQLIPSAGEEVWYKLNTHEDGKVDRVYWGAAGRLGKTTFFKK